MLGLSIGQSKGVEPESVGLAKAKAYEEQVKALGPMATTVVNAITALAEGKVKIMPDILVTGGGNSMDALFVQLTKWLGQGKIAPEAKTEPAAKPATEKK
jgi:hypothetical protein